MKTKQGLELVHESKSTDQLQRKLTCCFANHGGRLNENIRLLKMHRDKVHVAGGVDVPLQADILTLRVGGEHVTIPSSTFFEMLSLRTDQLISLKSER